MNPLDWGAVFQAVFQWDPVLLVAVVVRTVIVYFVLLALLKLGGKRQLGQLTVFDLVVVLIIANAVQNAMVGTDTSLSAGLAAATTLVLVNRAVNALGLRSRWLGVTLYGTPTLLVHDGELIEPHLRSEGVTYDELMQAAREHGVDDLKQIKSAVLEVDGSISVVASDGDEDHTRRRVRGRKPLA